MNLINKNKVNVAHLISGPLDAGAALAVSMLTESLNHICLDYCNTIVSSDLNNYDSKLYKPPISLASYLVKASMSLERRLLNYISFNNYFFSTGRIGYDENLKKVFDQFDIIHLHWIPGLVSLKAILEINKPIVVTLRDMWHLTGGCHYPLECTQYLSRCGVCPAIKSDRSSVVNYLVEDQHSLKKRLLNKPNVWICGITDWIVDEVRKTDWIENNNLYTIHNGVKLDNLKPQDKQKARRTLGLNYSGFLIGFCAQDISDPIKGLKDLLESLNGVESAAVKLLSFGKNQRNIRDEKILKHINFSISDEKKSIFYSSIDLLVVASKMEAFGKVAIEAMHFGVPVLTYEDIGTAEVISNEKTGFLANRSEGLAPILKRIYSMGDNALNLMKEAARVQASKYSIENCAAKYIKLYESMVKSDNGNYIKSK